MKRTIVSVICVFLLLAGVIPLLLLTAAPAGADPAPPATFLFPGGSITTTDTGNWGGYNTQGYPVHFDVDASPLTIEFLGVNLFPINYTGDFGWPPDLTDTGASAIVGVGDGINIAQYSVKSNMSGSKPRGTVPETYGKGSWNAQNVGHWNDDGYRSYLFQGQYTGQWTQTLGNSQFNAEKLGGPTGLDPAYDTFNIKMQIESVDTNKYAVTGWHKLWKSSARDEGCYWDWNNAGNAKDPAKQGYIKMFEGTWTANGGLDLSDVRVFLAIQNWQGTQPQLYSFDWDSVLATGTVAAPSTVVPQITAGDKVYDGTTAATLTSHTLAGVQPGEDVSLVVGAANFDDANAGVGKTVTATGLSLAGADAGNYVLASDTATTTADITKANTATTLKSSVNPAGLFWAILFERITFTASVAPVAPGAGAPAGKVIFKDGTKVLATVPLSGGKASCIISALCLGCGKHNITVTYIGDANFEQSVSPILVQKIGIL